MKKVGKFSDLYTSRDTVLHDSLRIITRSIKTAVDVSIVPGVSLPQLLSFDGWGQIDRLRQRLPSLKT